MSAFSLARSLTAPAELLTSEWPKAETCAARNAVDADADGIHDMSDASTDLASDGEADGEGLVTNTQFVLHLVDWDDTILPTYWLSSRGLLNSEAVANEEQRAQLAAVAEAAKATLEAAMAIGWVTIVTNAAEGWVQQSCCRFLPALAPLLDGLTIVSARTAFESQGVRCPMEWKRRAFDRELQGIADTLFYSPGASLSLVAMGDSSHEHDAVLKVAKNVPGCSTKSLRFAERPTPEQLVQEHGLVAGTLEEVAAHIEDLDIVVET